MKTARFARWQFQTPTVFAVACAFLLCAPLAILPLQGGDNSSPSQTVWLEYRELKQGAINLGLPQATQSTPFKKEPDLGRRKVVRGTLKFGNTTEQFLPFIWDQKEGKLYLDLNRNQDLTDDPGGRFSCSEPVSFANPFAAQTFTNLHLTFKTPMGSHPVCLDLQLCDYGQMSGWLLCRSCWEAKVSLQGREWQFGLVENLSGKLGTTESSYLVLRPWEERDQPLNLQGGPLDGFSFCRNLFFNRQAYQVECAYQQKEGAPCYRLELKERPAELGELKVTGKFIKRMVLPGQEFTVVLDHPDPVLKVPLGSYGQCQVQIQARGAEAYRESGRFNVSPTVKALTIAARTPAVLNVGGPLSNSVSAGRHGNALNLDYRLLGAGGEAYQLSGVRKQPEFAAYRAGKKIGSGKFEFG